MFSTFFVNWYGWNEESNFALTRALVEENRFEIDSFANLTGDRSFINSHYYSDKPPGLAFLSSFPYFFLKFFDNGFEPKGFISQNYGNATIITEIDRGPFIFTSMFLLTLLSVSIFTGLTTLLIFYLAKKIVKKHALFLSLSYFFATIAFHYALHFMTHAISTFFLFFSFFLLYFSKKLRNFLLAGIFLGISLLFENLILVLLPLFLVYSFFKLKKRYWSYFLIGLSIGVIPFFLYHLSITNKPFYLVSSFLDKQIFKHAYEVQSFDFIKIFHLEKPFPDLMVMLRILFYPYRGLFFYSPFLLFSIPGFILMFKKQKKEVLLIIFSLLLLTAVISMRRIWWGGCCFGERYLLPLIPFLFFPISYFVKRFGIKCLIPFFILSFFINLIGLQRGEEYAYDLNKMEASEIILEYESSFKILFNPLKDHYLPLFLKYGPRSPFFEHLINGNFIIDVRVPHISKGTDFPFSKFYIPFLCLLPLAVLTFLIWRKEIKIWLKKLKIF